jgi:hypothetical protein
LPTTIFVAWQKLIGLITKRHQWIDALQRSKCALAATFDAEGKTFFCRVELLPSWFLVSDPVRTDSAEEFRDSLVPARNADPIATATTKCDLMRSQPSKETKPS